MQIAQGLMDEAAFAAFLQSGVAADPLAGAGLVAAVALAFVGGLALNLTPCVLPMVPVNLMVIGRSAVRGIWYGLGIALAYGALGVAAAIGGLAFGTIQGNPWFNLSVSAVFVLLSLSLSGLFFIDLSGARGGLARKKSVLLPWLFAFLMGLTSAVLAGACVAPILISVLLLTGKLHAEGHVAAVALPFVLGLGMASPWPFLGAGLRVLPRPGAWMKWVNRLFALVVFGFALWYGRLAWNGFVRPVPAGNPVAAGGTYAATPETLPSVLAGLRADARHPVLLDCWATWCKNCASMERLMETSPKVREALKGYTVVRLQAEDLDELRALPGLGSIRGLPAFVLLPDPGELANAKGK